MSHGSSILTTAVCSGYVAPTSSVRGSQDYGQATFLPFQGEFSPRPGGRSASYRPEKSTLAPHTMNLRLERYSADVELVPTLRGAILQVKFDQLTGDEGALAIDLPGKNSDATFDQASDTVFCTASASAGGTPANFRTYYAVTIDRASESSITHFEVNRQGGACTAVIRYRATGNKPIVIRIGTSFISAEQSRRNLQQELGDRPLTAIKTEALRVWETHLGRAVVKAAPMTATYLLFGTVPCSALPAHVS